MLLYYRLNFRYLENSSH
uniref:Uncharacterized protein n=1 Tax=Rhizophora mucronata TaxID=61149 RepID=A0A2P2R2R8_RHIMU